MQTRKKSLSLPSLGIALPGAPRSARSPPSSANGQHVAKKQKRSHSNSNASTPASPPRPATLRFDERPKSSGRVADTPPPSPGGESGQTKVDTQGIDDVIVVGVIEQLEKTGNRPHLLKELATVLSPTIPIVESSANPAAIISSRLATYLKRNWTALSPCPLDKKLVGTHPKRVYYFLSTCPHQPIPEDAGNAPAAARIISPSLSSATSEEEDMDARSRDVRSPSPELDLSDFDDGSDPFSNRTHDPATHNIAHNRRAQSPPLERDEREFTQTASFLQQQRKSQEAERERSSSTEATQSTDVTMEDIPEVEETEESAARKNSETAAALFGQMDHVSSFQPDFVSSSPMLKPTLNIEMPPPPMPKTVAKIETEDIEWSWSEMKSPENIELDELDDLFGGY
ncbi:hypothetical protein BU26DRAFT_533813 [Trematosphaeria pertusa]|uniref:GDS1 winged helix domain-containing protein n=1 Tax=Trematosphaeria pertusa TaxID=390896 RepID=A0A6A6I2J8_9PLEO|nr:uncharacterized protein BU26DRAFT_533813 [Trematosphaeria pertusa]KAF2244379.1 hypothetical protein BU26DRAFT_533813 [Trematosphaeria pertusa]